METYANRNKEQDPLFEIVADLEAAEDDLHDAHFRSAMKAGLGYKHGFNSREATEATHRIGDIRQDLLAALRDAKSYELR